MEAGINFFPDVTPQERPADIYFDECLRMVSQADESYALCFRKVSKSLEGIMPIVGVTAMHVNNAYARRHRPLNQS